jgi:uncharacterized paraquat-inducible protein A
MAKKKYAYCKHCNIPIDQPRKKPMESLYHTIWLIVVISTLGLALIPLVIIHYLKKKVYCPNCLSILDFYETTEQLPNKRPAIDHIFERIEEEKKEKAIILQKGKIKEEVKRQKQKRKVKIEKINCPFCNKMLDKDTKICPYCGVSLIVDMGT